VNEIPTIASLEYNTFMMASLR